MARVKFYLSPTRLSTSVVDHTCLYSPAAEHHLPLAGTHFTVPWRVERLSRHSLGGLDGSGNLHHSDKVALSGSVTLPQVRQVDAVGTNPTTLHRPLLILTTVKSINQSISQLINYRQFYRPISNGMAALSRQDATSQSLADAHCSSAVS